AIMSQIEILGIDDQQRCAVVIMEKPGVGIIQCPEVVGADVLLDRYTALANTVTQNIQWRLQVDHQIGAGRVDGELVVNLLINIQLIVVQGDLGEQLVFFNKKIRHTHRLKNIVLAKRLQLVGALK